jgi:hypothetical protein
MRRHACNDFQNEKERLCYAVYKHTAINYLKMFGD